MFPTTRLGAAALLLTFLVSCERRRAPAPADDAAAPHQRGNAHVILRSRKCMGTLCEMKGFHVDDAFVERAFARGFQELDRIEALLSGWKETSEISRINAQAGVAPVKVSPETLEVIKKGLWLAELTAGAFDITIGVYRGLWKFDEDNDGTLPAPAEVERRRRLVNWKDVVVDESQGTVMLRRKGQKLNVEGIAKGYAVDAAARAIRAAGVTDFLIKAGGDLFAAGRRGDRAWRVGIQDPRGPHGRPIFEMALADQAFNTSGDYERFIVKDGVRYHHILDARTGFPARKARAVTVLAPDAFSADLLDTAIFVLGPDGMKLADALPGVGVVMIDAQNQLHVTAWLKDKLVTRAAPTDGL